MEDFTATITNHEGKVIVTDVEVSIRQGQSGGFMTWWGAFVAPEGSFVMPGDYRLTTADGRTAKIVITNSSIGSHEPNEVQFTGSGPPPR